MIEADADFRLLFIFNTCQIPVLVRMITSPGLTPVQVQLTKAKMTDSLNFIRESRKLTLTGFLLPPVLVKTKEDPDKTDGHTTTPKRVDTKRTPTRMLVLQWIFLKVCHYIFMFQRNIVMIAIVTSD